MSQAVANVVSLAVQPISEAAPAGESVRIDIAFENVKAEIDKMSTAGVLGVDWKKVATSSAEILEKKSKDLLVAAYMVRALMQLDGYAGLAESLDALHQMMAAYWDKCFPDRPKGRAAAFAWLQEKTAVAIQQKDPRASDKAALETAVEKIAAIDALLAEKMGGDAPSLREIKDSLEGALASVAAPPEAAPAESAPAAAAAPAISADTTSPEGCERAYTQALDALRGAAAPWRRADPRLPVPYGMLRFASWSMMSVAPAHENGLSSIPSMGASQETLERYEGMASRGQWADLLEESETMFEQSVLWLDLQRFSAAALKAMGPDYQLARAAVVGPLASLLRAFPGLQDLRFNDEFPLATDATKAWISEEVLAGAGSFESPTAVKVKGSPEDEEIKEIIAKGRELASRKNLKEAIHTVWVSLDGVGPRRLRFMRRLALAHFLGDLREWRLAVPILESLDEEIRRFTLEEWEPGLSLDALRLHLHCQRRLMEEGGGATPESDRREREIFGRLARLDAAAALELKSK